MPDFDIDFCEEKRDKVFYYLKQKYGKGVAHIVTFGKLKARMAFRDIGRVLGLPYGYVDMLCKMIPFDPSRPISLEKAIAQEPRIRKEEEKDSRVKKLVEISKKLEGLNRNMATHAAGVVIPEKNLAEFVENVLGKPLNEFSLKLSGNLSLDNCSYGEDCLSDQLKSSLGLRT